MVRHMEGTDIGGIISVFRKGAFGKNEGSSCNCILKERDKNGRSISSVAEAVKEEFNL